MTRVDEQDIRAAAMMIECGCDREWVAAYIGVARSTLNERLRQLRQARIEARRPCAPGR